MLNISLTALESHLPFSWNRYDRSIFANTIVWLEDQKIRFLPIEHRKNLRIIHNLKQWDSEYINYKRKLNVPSFSKLEEELIWLLSYALRLEYSDLFSVQKANHSQGTLEKIDHIVVPDIRCSNTLDLINFKHHDFESGVRFFADQLQLTILHSELKILLEAGAIVLKRYKSIKVRKSFPVKSSLIFSNNYSVTNYLNVAVKILLYNHILKHRDLQTRINEIIIAIQNITADPKTDSNLGKVGS